jgi:hypothetical protein
MAVVASLELWRQAAQSKDAASARRLARLSASWLLLLAGAVLAVVAAARPVWHAQAPARHVAIAVYPSAQLAGEGGLANLKSAATTLLNRLGQGDSVQVILPPESGGAGPWQSPADAARRVSQVTILPTGLADMPSLEFGPDAQHCYVIAPPGRDFAQGPNVSVIRVPAAMAPVTIESVGIAPGAYGGTGFRAREAQPGKAVPTIELFAAFRNNTSSAIHAQYRLDWFEQDSSKPAGSRTFSLAIAPMAREERVIADLPSAAAYALVPAEAGDGGTPVGAYAQPRKAVLPGADAYFVRWQARRVSVAIAGTDQPMLRKYVAADPMLELVESARDAQLILAQGAQDDFGEKPAMIFEPAKPPPGWGEDKPAGPVRLADADIAADDASGIMRESQTPTVRPLDLSGVVVRQVRPWTPYETAGNMRVLLGMKDAAGGAGDALVLRSAPEDSRDAQPRRVYTAFGIDERNTNFATRPGFVIFMANSVRWLAQKEKAGGDEYVSVQPSQAGPWRDWQKVSGPEAGADGSGGAVGGGATGGEGRSSALPWPGLYKDTSGQWHAVSLAGLASPAADAIAPTTIPAQDYLAAIAALPLPPPKPSPSAKELWPALLLLAMLMWIAGWTLRLR